MIYTDADGNPTHVDYVAPSEWGEVREHVRRLGYELGEDLVPGNEGYIQSVAAQCRHYPKFPWVWHCHELIPIVGN